ncbi:MAG: hypothetical protein ACP5G8_02045, partial [Athalassotoga sp.]
MMYSYTYLEKEISKSYRDRLNESKKPSEVQEIFSKSILTLLSKITEELGNYEVNDLKLIPLDKQKYEMSEKM